MNLEDNRSIIKDLKNNKAAGGGIPLTLLKKCDFTYEKLTNCINNSKCKGLFPDSLKRANITPVHKNTDPLDKENYRPVSMLPLLSKVYERVIFNQLTKYMQIFLKIKFFAGSVKLIALTMLYLNYFKHDKENLINLVM